MPSDPTAAERSLALEQAKPDATLALSDQAQPRSWNAALSISLSFVTNSTLGSSRAYGS